MIRILAFSDPHGRIPLLLRLVWQYGQKTGCAPDLVVVAGDMGVWPREDCLDNATRKHARSDWTELGFLAFDHYEESYEGELVVLSARHRAREQRLVEAIKTDIVCPVVFVGGNHEDYDYLLKRQAAEEEVLVPVERQGILNWLPPGRVFELRGVTVAGLSGIGAAEAGRDPDRYHRAGVLDDDSVLEALVGYDGQRVDILLTHDGLPDVVRSGRGTGLIEEVIESLRPRFHVFGHYHAKKSILYYSKLRSRLHGVPTLGVHLNKLGFDQNGLLRPNSVGLFEGSDPKNIEFRFLDEPWMQRVTQKSWLHLP